MILIVTAKKTVESNAITSWSQVLSMNIFDLFSPEDISIFDSTKQPESDEDQQGLNEDQSDSDDDTKSSMLGLQERSREDSSSEDENS